MFEECGLLLVSLHHFLGRQLYDARFYLCAYRGSVMCFFEQVLHNRFSL